MAENKNKKAMDKEITDSLLDDFDKFEHYAMKYWKQIFAVAIIIVVVAIIVAVGYSVNAAKERKINNAIANAKNVEELQKVIAEYPNDKSIIFAYSSLAQKFIGKKEFKKAEATYQTLLSKEIPNDMKWQISVDCAYLKELSGDKKKAIEMFSKIGSDSMFPPAMRCEANFSAGRLEAKVGDKKKAENYLKFAMNLNDPNNVAVSFWVKQASSLLQTLKTPAKKTSAQAPKKATAVKPVVTAPKAAK